MAKWTARERREILSKPFEIFPVANEEMLRKGIKRGPFPWQRGLFNYTFSREQRLSDPCLSCHPEVYDLAFASAGPGKSLVGSALSLWWMTTFPGCTIAIGAAKYKDLDKNVIQKYLMPLLSINRPWDHPWVKYYPTENNKKMLVLEIEVAPGVFKTSTAYCLHYDDYERLRGMELSFIMADEISQLKDAKPLEELTRRLRSSYTPCRQLFCTTNPPESLSHWLYDKWDLTHLMPNHRGEKPPIKTCNCHLCQDCLNAGLGEFTFIDGKCSNPYCHNLVIMRANKLPEIPAPQPMYKYPGDNVPGPCPGNQILWRVFNADAADNFSLPATYMQSTKTAHDDATYSLYMKGIPDSLGSNKAYRGYSLDNVINDLDMDHNKDIHWSFDFNIVPQCSVLVQLESRTIEDKQEVCPIVIDEIVLYKHWNKDKKIWSRGAGPEHVALEFVKRYTEWNERGERKHWVILHGDSTALNNKQSPSNPSDYQIIVNILQENGFNVLCTLRKVPGSQNPPETKRTNCLNWMLLDHKGNRRILICRRNEHLRKSLEDMEIDKSTNRLKKKAQDDAVANHTNLNSIHLQSHSSDALAYLIVRKWDLVKTPDGFPSYVYIPGYKLLNIDTDNVSGINIPEPVESFDKKYVPIEQLAADKGSVLEWLRKENETFQDDNNFLGFYS